MTVSVNQAVQGPRSPLNEFWFYFKQNKGAVIGLGYVVFIILMALLADLLAPHSPIEQFRDFILTPPAFSDGGNAQFFLGTDGVGRDILSRLMHGARLSLMIGLIIVSLSLVLGICLGLFAGYFGGFTDTVIMRVSDILQSLPALLLAIAIVAVLGPSILNSSFALSLVYLPHYIRLTRASVLAERNRDYVISSRVAGAGSFRLMFITILPNCLAPLIVQATLGFSNAILDMAALGFLGLGAQPPLPEWGSMLATAREFIQSAWWVVTFPGLMILTTVLAFNLMGDGLRDALDPKLKQ